MNMQSITEQIVAQMATRWAAAIDALGAEMMADGRLAAGWRIGYRFGPSASGRTIGYEVFPYHPGEGHGIG